MEEKIQITIIGTGMIGTSIGLALHAAEAPVLIVGHDKDPEHAGQARKIRAVDKTDWNLIGACEEADMIVLATPISAMEPTLQAIATCLKAGCVVTDTANLKVPVGLWAKATLSDQVSYVGGSPLLAAPGSGPEDAKVDLFRDCRYCLVPAVNAHPDAVGLVSSMVKLLGADPYFLDPVEHDSLVAGVAHLPTVLALALTDALSNEPGWREMRKFAGNSFDAFTTLLEGDPQSLTQALLSNRQNLLRWLDAYTEKTQQIRQMLAEDAGDTLDAAVKRAVTARASWMRDRETRFSETPEVPRIERPNLLDQVIPRRFLKRG